MVSVGTIELDSSSREGGSSLIGGGTEERRDDQDRSGDGTLSAATVVSAAKIANFMSTTCGTVYGVIDITGNDSTNLARPIAATLDIAGAAGFGVTGVLEGSGQSRPRRQCRVRGGQITTIAANSELSLSGRDLVVADAASPGSNSALKRLDTVIGELNLSFGATVTTSGDLTNSGTVNLDRANGGGGSFRRSTGR